MCLDFDLLRYGQRVVNIDAQIAHRALNLRVSKQTLNRTQIAGATVDQCGLCLPQRVRAIDMGVESKRPGKLPRVRPGAQLTRPRPQEPLLLRQPGSPDGVLLREQDMRM